MSDQHLSDAQRLDPFANRMFTGTNDLFAPYLGPSARVSKTDPYERRKATKWNLPENERGKNNPYILDTIEDLVYTADNTWYTTIVMPRRPTEDLHLQWTNLTANAHIMDYTPYQTDSTLTTQERQIRRSSLFRRGIGAEFENDFLTSPLGRVSFMVSLNQITRSEQETANLEVLRALVQAHSFQHEWQRKHGIIRERDLKGYQRKRRFRFAIVQKTKNGLAKLDSEINSEVRQAGGRVDAWILHENTSRYAELVRPEVTDYYLAGYRGPDIMNGQGQKLKALAGTTDPLDSANPKRLVETSGVFIARNFNVPDMPNLDIMIHIQQIGEYNTMIDENSDYSNYSSESRNISIYNEEIDDFSKITLDDAIRHCGLWDSEGKLRPINTDTRRGGNVRDMKRDFLTWFDETNKPNVVKQLWQIDPLFLSEKILLNASRTIENSIKRNQKDLDITQEYLNGILGTNFAQPEIQNFLDVATKVPVVADAQNVEGDVATYSELESGFLQMLIQSVPAPKRKEIKEISDSEGGFEAKLASIRGKFEEYRDTKVAKFKLRKEGDVEEFFDARMAQLQTQRQEIASQLRTQASASSSDIKIMGYRAPGLNLTGTGVKYLYKGSERKSTGNRLHDSDSTLREISDQIHDLRQSKNSGAQSGSSRPRDTGAGLGFEGVGMMAFGDSRGRSKYPNPDPLIDQLLGKIQRLTKHRENIKNGGGTQMQKALAKMFLYTQVTEQNMLRLAANDILVPLNFLLFRPHMSYRMRLGIKTAIGGRAGHFYHGKSNAMIQGDVSKKTSKIHYTTHMRAVVEKPQNVYVQDSMQCEEYLGGNGIRFWTPESYKSRDRARITRSIICVAIPPVEHSIPNPMDSSGRFYVEYNAGLLSDDEFNELHYSTAYRYNALYGFHVSAISQGGDLPTFKGTNNMDNREMYQGHQWMFNPKTNSFDKVRTNKGHWGKNVYPGVGQVRAGELKYMDEIDYTKFSTM